MKQYRDNGESDEAEKRAAELDENTTRRRVRMDDRRPDCLPPERSAPSSQNVTSPNYTATSKRDWLSLPLSITSDEL